jgi:hypothetical protein
MRLFQRLMGRSLFAYVPTRTDAGIGTGNLAYVPTTGLPLGGGYDPARMVRRSLGPQAPGFVKTGQTLVPASLMGNGNTLTGTYNLTSLSQMKKANG